MRLRHSVLTGIAALICIASANGVAEEQNKDRTGSPDGSNTCIQCHNSGPYSPIMSINVENEDGETVETYIEGETYTIQYLLNAFTPFPDVHGFQSTSLFEDLTNAGTFQNPGIGVQLEEVNTPTIQNRHIVEHSNPGFFGSFTVEWVASSNNGPVTFYAAGVVGNGDNEPEGDNGISVTKTLNHQEPDSIEEIDDQTVQFNISQGNLYLHSEKIISIDRIMIYDLSGTLVFTKNSQIIPASLSIAHLNKGIYLLLIKGEDFSQAMKVLL